MLASRATQCCAGHCTALDDFHSLDDLQLPVAVKVCPVPGRAGSSELHVLVCQRRVLHTSLRRALRLTHSLTVSVSTRPLTVCLSVTLSASLSLSLCLLSVGWLAGDTYSIFIQ